MPPGPDGKRCANCKNEIAGPQWQRSRSPPTVSGRMGARGRRPGSENLAPATDSDQERGGDRLAGSDRLPEEGCPDAQHGAAGRFSRRYVGGGLHGVHALPRHRLHAGLVNVSPQRQAHRQTIHRCERLSVCNGSESHWICIVHRSGKIPDYSRTVGCRTPCTCNLLSYIV